MQATTQAGGSRPASAVKNSTPKNKLKILSITLALVIFLATAVFTAIPALVISGMVDQHVAFDQTWSGAAYGLDPQRLVLKTMDGLNVVAYEAPAEQPKAVLIFLSGIHNPSVTAFFGHARMLLDHGYASVLLEMRPHGESEGQVIGLGYQETLDVQAVVEYIKSESRYAETPIVVYGLSMGGAVAINSIGQFPEIDGLISLSAYSAWEDVFLDNMGLPEPLAVIQRPFVRLYIRLKYGAENRQMTPRQQIRQIGQ